MKEFFNIKKKHLIIIWVITLIIIGTNEDSYSPNQVITLIGPIMLIYTLGWLGYKNSR
jgi:hypothetical protein